MGKYLYSESWEYPVRASPVGFVSVNWSLIPISLGGVN